MNRRLVHLLLAGCLAMTGACGSGSGGEDLNLQTEPRTVFFTNPFEVGESYTLGSSGVPEDVPRPVQLIGIEVLHTSGVEVLGVGAFDSAIAGTGIGLVPGWPPTDPPVNVQDPFVDGRSWPGRVDAVIGLRILEPMSGLRGIKLSWIDGQGAEGAQVFDLAVVTCSPESCEAVADDAEWLLEELGLFAP